MSERIPRLPHRIPTEEDYDTALQLVERLLDSKGGAWNYYHKVALLEVHSNQTTQNLLVNMSSQARLVEAIEDDELRPVDPLFRATHAFRAGMWTGGFISQEMHKNVINYSCIPCALFSGIRRVKI